MSRASFRSISIAVLAVATLLFLLVITVPGHFVAISGAPGPIVPPPPSHMLAISGAPGPIVPPPPSHMLAISGAPGPIVPPPPPSLTV